MYLSVKIFIFDQHVIYSHYKLHESIISRTYLRTSLCNAAVNYLLTSREYAKDWNVHWSHAVTKGNFSYLFLYFSWELQHRFDVFSYLSISLLQKNEDFGFYLFIASRNRGIEWLFDSGQKSRLSCLSGIRFLSLWTRLIFITFLRTSMLNYMSIVFVTALGHRVQAIVLVNSIKIWPRKRRKHIR